MSTYVLSRSASFDRHVLGVLAPCARAALVRSTETLPPAPADVPSVVLVHARSFPTALERMLEGLVERADLAVGLAEDAPTLEGMLAVTGLGVQAYFNSYMADLHYQQMLRQVESGQTWFVPELLERALDVARTSLRFRGAEDPLAPLTPREREIALDVARGLSNREIAHGSGISERTVKSHLTRVFKKLGLKSRHALAIELRAEPPERLASIR